MKKIIAFVVLAFIVLSDQRLSAQECKFSSDTVYVFFLQYELKNQRPVNSFFVLKDLNNVRSLRGLAKQQDLLCWFYQNSIVFQFLETSNFQSCYAFENKEAKEKFYREYYKKYEKMNKSYTSFFVKDFSDVPSTIKINCLKLYGDFWISDKETVISDQVYSELCTHQPKEYSLKNIFQFWKLTKDEKRLVSTFKSCIQNRR